MSAPALHLHLKFTNHTLVAPISQRMMQNLAALLSRSGRVPDNVNNRHILAVCTPQSAESTQLTRSKGGDECTGSLLASIAVCGVGTDQLVGGAQPFEALGLDEVQES